VHKPDPPRHFEKFSDTDLSEKKESKKIPTYRERIGFTGGDQEPLPLWRQFFLHRQLAGSESLGCPTAVQLQLLRLYAVLYTR